MLRQEGRAEAGREGRLRLLDADLGAGELAGVEYRTDPLFGFEVPVSVPGVDSGLLQPRLTWADPEAYDAKARELADMFRENFSKFTADDNIVAGGPRA